MNAYERVRRAIRAEIRRINQSGQWHMEDVVTSLEFLLEEIDRIEAEHGV